MNKLYLFIGLLCLLGCSSVPVSPLPEWDSASNPPPSSDSAMPMDAGVPGYDATEEGYFFDSGPPCLICYDASYSEDVDASHCVEQDADLAKIYVTNDISLIKAVDVPYPGDAGFGIDTFGVISDTINSGVLPYDPDGLYFLMPSTEVPVDGFCYYFCGYHDSYAVSFGDGGLGLVRYAVVPDLTNCEGFYGCNPWSVSGVSNVDGMVSVMAHELAESASDPDPLMNGFGTHMSWRDSWGYEVGDKCAWSFGDVFIGHPSDGNSIYNVDFGNRHWLIQQMWSLSSPGGLANHCVLDMNGNPGFNEAEAGFPIILDGGPQNEIFPMQYWGGTVLSNPIHIYYIYYGAWADVDTAHTKSVLKQFANGIGGSDWWKIMTPYWAAPGCLGDGGTIEAGTDAATMEASTYDSNPPSIPRRGPPAARFERVYGHRP